MTLPMLTINCSIVSPAFAILFLFLSCFAFCCSFFNFSSSIFSCSSYCLSAVFYLFDVFFIYPFFGISTAAADISVDIDRRKHSHTHHNVVARAMGPCITVKSDDITASAFGTFICVFHLFLLLFSHYTTNKMPPTRRRGQNMYFSINRALRLRGCGRRPSAGGASLRLPRCGWR